MPISYHAKLDLKNSLKQVCQVRFNKKKGMGYAYGKLILSIRVSTQIILISPIFFLFIYETKKINNNISPHSVLKKMRLMRMWT